MINDRFGLEQVVDLEDLKKRRVDGVSDRVRGFEY